MKKQVIKWLAVFSLLLTLLPTPTQAAGTAEEIWPWKSTATGNRAGSITMFGSNLINETGADSSAYPVYDSESKTYNAEGPFRVKAMAFRGETTKNASEEYYGAHYRIVPNTDGSDGSYLAATEAVEFYVGGELGVGPTANLNTTGYEAMNIKFIYMDVLANADNVVPYCRDMEVYVTLDGETWLGPVGIRSTQLLGGGKANSGGTYYDVLVYEIQTEDLLSIAGVKGETIQKIKVVPEGTDVRPSSRIIFSEIAINGYTGEGDFESAVPAENRGTVSVTEEELRDLVVAEALRTANLQWTPEQDITVTYTNPDASHTLTYEAGTTYFGPIYNRSMDATREQLEAAIDNGTYGAAMDDYQQMLGMDCQTFAFNATSRVSQNYGWAVTDIPAASGLTLLGEENLKTSKSEEGKMMRFTDVDICDRNSQADMETYNYDQLQKGDLLVHVMPTADYKRHVRIVQSVDTANETVTCIESSSGFMERTVDGVTGQSSSFIKEYSYDDLFTTDYVGYTLDTYAQAAASGTIEDVDVEAVFSPKEAGKGWKDAGVHLSVASNYRIVGYTVELKDSTGQVLFTDTQLPENEPQNVGFVYESTDLDETMAGLTSGDYTLSVTVNSGPVGEDGEVPSIPVSRKITVCDHTDWTPLTESTTTLTGGTNYYLSGDVTLNKTTYLYSGEVTLCLNGYTLQAPSGDKNYAIGVVGGTLNLCDCSVNAAGTVKGNGGPRVILLSDTGRSSTLNLRGGTVTGGGTSTSTGNGAGVRVKSGGTLNMYDGAVITGNQSGSGNGGGVSVETGATFNMYGGSITGNVAGRNAGGVYVAGTFNMSGGTISGNTDGNGQPQVYVSGGTITRTGGTIEGWSTLCPDHTTGWDVLDASTTIETGKSYYLTDDVDLSASITLPSGVDVTICLNGHTLNAASTGTVFTITGGTLNLCDCSAGKTGKVQGNGSDRVIAMWTKAGTLNLYGGTITGGKRATGNGAGLRVDLGTVNMYGGKITGNTATAGRGGGVDINGSTVVFNMYGGEISGNTAGNHGGGVYNSGTFNMSGGTISGNTANGQYGGGGIYAAGTVTLNSGSITGNHAIHATGGNGGGVRIGDKGKVTMNDGVTIQGNDAAVNGGGVFVAGSCTFTMNGGTISGNADTAGNDEVSVASAGAFYKTGGTVSPCVGNGVHGDDWTVFDSTTTLETGKKYYLEDDVDLSAQLTVSVDVTICLNGNTLKAASGKVGVHVSGGKLNICDCSVNEAGKLQGNGERVVTFWDYAGILNLYSGQVTDGTRNSYGAGVCVQGEDRIFNMYGGKIHNNQNTSSTTFGGGVGLRDGARFNMYGGEISNNKASNAYGGGVGVHTAAEKTGSTFYMYGGIITDNAGKYGGGVIVSANGSTFTMSGGDITKNTATNGGGVYVQSGSTFTMSGGSIDDNTATGYAGGIYAGGSTTITGGTISNNDAAQEGGGIRQGDSSTVTMSGDAKIIGNTTKTYGGGVYVQSSCTFNMNGGTISGNTAVSGGSGVYGKSTIAVTAGSIAGEVETTESATVTISGGQFSGDTEATTLTGWVSDGCGMKEVWTVDSDYVYTVGADVAGFYSSGEHMDFDSSLALGLYLLPTNSADLSACTVSVSGITDTCKLGTVGDPAIDVLYATGIAAKAMDEEITFTVTSGDTILFQKTVSIYDAAEAWHTKESAKEDADAGFITMLADMINYGIEAQKVFINDGEYMTSLEGGTDEIPVWTATEGAGVTAGYEDKVAVTLSLKERIELNVYINGAGATVTAVVGADTPVVEDVNGITRISFRGIPVVNVKDAVTFTVTLADETSFNVTYSIKDYVIKALADTGNEQSDLLKALQKYVDAVSAYVAQ